MSRILCIWELGDDFGHLSKLYQIVNELSLRGHYIGLVIKDLTKVIAFDLHPDIKLFQAPIWRTKSHKPVKTTCMPDILTLRGFSDVKSLRASSKAWLDIYDLFQPDLILFDYAPTALLASRGKDVRRVVVGSGFYTLPPGEGCIDLLPWIPKPPNHIEKEERAIVTTINNVLSERNRPKVKYLSDLYLADDTFLAMVPELDMYHSSRQNVTYLKPFGSLSNQEEPCWPSNDKPKVFAYLKSGCKQFDMVLNALAKSGADCLVFCPDASNETIKLYKLTSLKISTKPLDMSRVFKCADLVVCHGGGMISQSVLAGCPLFVIPMQLEQRHNGIGVEQKGIGLQAKNNDTTSDLLLKINNLISDPSFKRRAEELSNKYNFLLEKDPMEVICGRCEELLQ